MFINRSLFFSMNKPVVETSFLPSDLSNLALWLKPDAGITLVSGKVDVWADQSGNGRDLTAHSSGTRLNVASAHLNGYDIPYTAEDANALQTAGNFPNSNGVSIFMVASQDSGEEGYGQFFDSAGGLGGTGISAARDSTTTGMFFTNNTKGQSGTVKLTLTDGTYYTLSMRDDGSNFYTAKNADSEASIASQGTTNSNGVLYLGSRNSYNVYSSKHFAELIIYTAGLSLTDANKVRVYLKNRYNHY